MMEDILNILLNMQACEDSPNQCPASAFTAIGAAFATQGYYLQSSIVSAIGAGGMEMWGVFLYMFSFFAFTIMIILNGLSIPKNVMWFVLGPALFNWMIYNGTDVKGVGWRVGNAPRLDQGRVWEIAEPGLRNIDPIVSGELDEAQTTESTVNKKDGMPQIRVPWLFVFWDELISDTVAQLSSWVGADRLRGGQGTSNLGDGDIQLGKAENNRTGMASILANLKWSKLQGITNARISTPGLRDAFTEFMSGPCSEKFKELIDETKIATARRGQWQGVDSLGEEVINIFDKQKLENPYFANIYMSKSGHIKKIWESVQSESKKSGLKEFLNESGIDIDKKLNDPKSDAISCGTTFNFILHALRWEAASAYHKMMADWSTKKTESKEEEVLAAFYYGWNLDRSDNSGRVSKSNLKYFTRDMIFAYLLRNELEFVPKMISTQFSTKVQSEQAADTHIANVGSQNKYGEIYTWARMMPYIQGILMFILAGAYPIVCIVFLIPGAHKTIITWAAFWAWVKFWDFGFALVSVIERSVWGVLGNSDQAKMSNRLLAIVTNGKKGGLTATEVYCGDSHSMGGGNGSGFLDCVIPYIKNNDTSTDVNESLKIFGEGTAIGLSLNYGVYNGYYIYIMAALYMAVPVICGQVILQGKHGVGSLASMMTGGAEKAAGGAAEAAAKSKVAAAINQTIAGAEKATKAEAAKKYAMRAMEAGNKAASSGLLSSAMGQKNKQTDVLKGALDNVDSQNNALATQMKNIGSAIASKNYILGGLLGGTKVVTDLHNAVGKHIGPKYQGKMNDFFNGIGGFLANPLNVNNKSGAVGATGGTAFTALNATGATGADQVGGYVDWQKTSNWFGLPFDQAAANDRFNHFNPIKEDILKSQSMNNAADFDYQYGQSLNKNYADRMNTMAKYEGEQAWYDAKSELANDMQNIAGVYGINLQPTQQPYDIQAMMGKGEIVDNDTNTNAQGMFNFFGDLDHGAGKIAQYQIGTDKSGKAIYSDASGFTGVYNIQASEINQLDASKHGFNGSFNFTNSDMDGKTQSYHSFGQSGYNDISVQHTNLESNLLKAVDLSSSATSGGQAQQQVEVGQLVSQAEGVPVVQQGQYTTPPGKAGPVTNNSDDPAVYYLSQVNQKK